MTEEYVFCDRCYLAPCGCKADAPIHGDAQAFGTGHMEVYRNSDGFVTLEHVPDEAIYGDAQSDAAEAGAIYGNGGLSFAYDPNVVAEDLVRINDSGIIPTEFKVLVLPDVSEAELRLKRSGLAVPDAYAAIYAHGTVTGTIIAISPAAFSYHDWPEGCRIPVVGERIVFGRYAGMLVAGKPVRNERGHDEPREYRLMNDKDIAAVLEF